MKQTSFLIGSDPEIIIANSTGPCSAEGLINARKGNPLVIGDVPVIEDNILLEYNTNPANSYQQFVYEQVNALRAIYLNILQPRQLSIYNGCYAEYSKSELNTEQAQTIGCDPEYDAFNERMIEPPEIAGLKGRSAGGHIHIGYPNEQYELSLSIIKYLDIRLGVPSLILDPETRRRQLYGKASSYRHDSGLKVEYRTLSNFWIFSSELIFWVYSTVKQVVEDVLDGCPINEEMYQEAYNLINNDDIEGAKRFLERNSFISYPQNPIQTNILDLVQSEPNTIIDEYIKYAKNHPIFEEEYLEGEIDDIRDKMSFVLLAGKSKGGKPSIRGILTPSEAPVWRPSHERPPIFVIAHDQESRFIQDNPTYTDAYRSQYLGYQDYAARNHFNIFYHPAITDMEMMIDFIHGLTSEAIVELYTTPIDELSNRNEYRIVTQNTLVLFVAPYGSVVERDEEEGTFFLTSDEDNALEEFNEFMAVINDNNIRDEEPHQTVTESSSYITLDPLDTNEVIQYEVPPSTTTSDRIQSGDRLYQLMDKHKQTREEIMSRPSIQKYFTASIGSNPFEDEEIETEVNKDS